MNRCRNGLIGLFSLLLVASAQGDVVFKKDGGKVEGEVLDRAPGADEITIKTRFGTISLPLTEVKEIRRSRSVQGEYRQRHAKVADTAEAHFELALWCAEQDLSEEYQHHLEEVITREPDHAEARRRLGHEKRGDKWLTENEARAADGLVRYRGKWMLPQERARQEAELRDKKRRVELGRLIRTAQRGLHASSRPDRQEEARQQLLAIDEPLAIDLLMRMLGEKGDSTDRQVLIDVLAGIAGAESTAALVEVALVAAEEMNRLAAAEALAPRKSAALLSQLVKELANEDNRRVRRSAVILGMIGDSSVVPPLVDALITTHERVIEPTQAEIIQYMTGQPVQTSRTVILPDGTIVRRNLIAGQTAEQAFARQVPRRRVIVEEERNGEVLEALQQLTGENFGFSEPTWRDWLKAEYRDAAGRLP